MNADLHMAEDLKNTGKGNLFVIFGERRADGETEGLLEVVDAVDRGDAAVLTSAMALAEVLGDGADARIRSRFEALFRRPNMLLISPTPAMFASAGDLRVAARGERRGLKAPDAMYIATAMAYHCEALHTFDDKLIALSGREYSGSAGTGKTIGPARPRARRRSA